MSQFWKAAGTALLYAVVSLVLLDPSAQGQTTYGAIVGTALDATGAVLPGVQVTITNQKTDETHTRPTTGSGTYAFTTLFPGIYRIRAEASGFKPIEIRDIQIQVNQTARFDLTLEVGQLTESVEVVATVPVLASETSEVGQVITNRQIVDLPLNGRNFMQLATLTNGVVASGGTESGGPQIISQGGRPTQNSFLVDGVETRLQREGGYGLNLSVDAIQEFKLIQNSFSAEYGRGTLVVNAAIKSGGNEFHGTAFEFLRNDKLDARNAFDSTNIKPPLRQNQFGASLGGPIRRDKTFFFFNYEGQRINRSSTRYAIVPTPDQLAGNLSGMATAIDPNTGAPFPQNQIPDDRISAFAKATVANNLFPEPNHALIAGSNYLAVMGDSTAMNQGTARIDHTIGPNDRITAHVTFFRYNNLSPGTLPYSGSQTFTRANPNVAAEWTHTFSPRLLNDFRFGFANTTYYNGPDQLAIEDLTKAFGLRNLAPEVEAYAAPQVNIEGFSSPGSGAWIPQGSSDVNRQFVEQLTWMTGRHTVKFGGDVRFLIYDDLGYATQNGYYNFVNSMYTHNAVADFLLGLPQQAFADQKGGKSFSMYLRNSEYSGYVQDDIKLRPNLTINAGLRYEYAQWPLEINDELASWNFQKGTMDFAGKNGISRRIAPADRNNFSPRLGFAWTPIGKTVIRAGAGIMYGNFRQWEISLFHFNPPYIYDNFQFNSLPNPSFTTDTLWPAVQTDLSKLDFRTITVNYQSPNKVLPYTYQWNFSIQRELPKSILFEIGYVGNRGVRQPNRWDANQANADADPLNPSSIQSRRPYQNVAFVSGNTSEAWSNYNALDLRVERRFAQGFSILASYTISKSMGIRPWDNWTVMDINNIRMNYGPVNDNLHRGVISYVWDLPFGPGKLIGANLHGVPGLLAGGWQVNGITSFRSGSALSVYSSVSNDRGNRAGNYANRIADGNLPTDQRTADRWFDTSAFTDPLFGVYGNSGEGVLRGPGAMNWDLSFFKNTRIQEGKTLQFRWEMFNAFNKVNLSDPNTWVGYNFGVITSASTAREMQAGLKFIF
jgi:hypothetical protein